MSHAICTHITLALKEIRITLQILPSHPSGHLCLDSPVLDTLKTSLLVVASVLEADLAMLKQSDGLIPAIDALLAKGNAPKTAFLSACDQLRIVHPTCVYSVLGPSGPHRASLTFELGRVFSASSESGSRAVAEAQAYISLFSDLKAASTNPPPPPSSLAPSPPPVPQ
jgi:hypothetical protein